MNECYRKRGFINRIVTALTAVILAVTGCAGKKELPAEEKKITDSSCIKGNSKPKISRKVIPISHLNFLD